MTMRGRVSIAVVAGLVVLASGRSAPLASQVPQITPELLLDQAKRLFDAFQYDQAVPQLDRLVTDLNAAGQVQRPEILAEAYQYRGRARFALGDQSGAEQDFSALLALNPSFRLGADVSPRVLAVFDAVRALTVGQLLLSLSPAGELTIGSRTIQAGATPTLIDVTVGEQEVVAKRPGHTDFVQRVSVAAGPPATLAIVLERVSATLMLSTIPADVEVVVNGAAAGTTPRGTGEASAVLQVDNLPTGTHRLVFRRPCFQDEERTVTITKPDEFSIDPVRLTPSVATMRITATDPSAVILVDGARRGTGKLEITNLCEGPHVIEARSSKGRFIDRRQWTTGDDVTLTATLRAAFPIVATTGVPPAALERLQQLVERALEGSRHVLIFFLPPADVARALEAEVPPPGWLGPEGAESGAQITREVRREIGRKLAARLEAQGVAALRAGADFNQVTLTLLASGSGEPESLALDLNDPASRTRVNDLLNVPLPRLVRSALDASIVDIHGTVGAMVVRVGAVASKAGLAVGDLITSAGGSPVTSVADLRARLAAVKAPGEDVPLGVRTGSGPERAVSGAVFPSAETLPTRDIRLLYNRALLDLREASAGATSPIDIQAARVNLAIVEMRLGNWEDALKTLSGVQLAERAGVSPGTVAYFVGLCHEALGQTSEATAAFTRAAAAADARLSVDGPRVAPLAQAKLGLRR